MKLLQDKINEIQKKCYVIKLISPVGITLTFLTVFGYLGCIVDGGVVKLLKIVTYFFI